MARIRLLILLCCYGSLAPAQTDSVQADYRRYETRDLGYYRLRYTSPNPYSTLPAQQPATMAPLGGDSTRRRVPLRVDMSPSLSSLLLLRQQENNALSEVDGFRVQVYSGSSRERASGIRWQMAGDHSQHQAYQFYDRPFFKVRVGDFYSKLAAEKLCAEIRKKIRGAFVVPDKVKLQ